MACQRRFGRLRNAEWDTPILHADLDAFYASVEVIRNPDLRGKPVVVGGTTSRGVVTSASYEARRYGVTSAMPTSRARRLCPDGIFIQPNFEAYQEYSTRVREVFDSYSPVVEPLSLDEAFLDVSGARRIWSAPSSMAGALRKSVWSETGLTVSVGLAPNKFLAKLASAKAKPNGVMVVRPDDVEEFLRPLQVGDLWGVGVETASILERFGLKTVGDVAKVPVETLERALGSIGPHLARLARGSDDRRVVADAPRQSLSAEETFDRDLADESQLLHALLELADRVSARLRAKGISGQTVTLKVRFANFTTVTRSKTLPHEIDGATGIYQVVRGLASFLIKCGSDPAQLEGRSFGLNQRVRLLGISVSKLKEWPASSQLTLERAPRWWDADRALDRVRSRFGDEALLFGSLAKRAGP